MRMKCWGLCGLHYKIKMAKKKHAGGRPAIVTDAVLAKLEHAFSMGATDKEASLYANISPSTLYHYQESHPEFLERKDQLKQTPIMKARTTVVQSLKRDVNSAWRYLERKDPDMRQKNEVDITSKGEQVNMTDLQAIAAQAAALLKENET